MSIFGLPLNMFQVPSGVDMGDLEYVEGKVLAGDYFEVSGDINGLNDTIEFIVPTGKTAFLVEAKITMSNNPGTTANVQTVADLLIDGVQKSKSKIGMASILTFGVREPGGPGWGVSSEAYFSTLGKSLVGDNVKKIEIKNVVAGGAAFAEMSGYLV